MPVSSIALILLRLFALNWFVVGLIQLASSTVIFRPEYFSISALLPTAVYLVAGILVWRLSPQISRLLARGSDDAFDLRGITSEQLYSAVFLGLGLYFTLTSFGSAFSWVHFFAVNKSPDYGFQQEAHRSYYDMSETLMTFAAGIMFIVTCRTWAAKLARKSQAKTALDNP